MLEANNIEIKAGNVLSVDEFYDDDYQLLSEMGRIWSVLCVEMETAGLYTIAAKFKVNALGNTYNF